MPEVAVDEDRDFEAPEHEVGTSRKVPAMLLPLQAGARHKFCDRTLRFSALSPYPRHDGAAGRRTHDVPTVQPDWACFHWFLAGAACVSH
jgi:hypothetical protein